MTDEKENSAPADAPDFGEIEIGGAAPHRPRTRSVAAAPTPSSPAVPPEKKSARQKKAYRSGGRGRLCLVSLLLLPPALLLFWLIGAFYLLPLYVQGPLAEKLSRQLGRSVTVGQASLAPFKLILRLHEITVGPAADRTDEPELARIASAEARIRPSGLLKGQLLLEDVSVDRLRTSLIRRRDGSFNALPQSGLFSGFSLLPPWLHLRDLRLHRSTAHFFDQPSGKKHLIEHIEFVLPAAGQNLDPSLSAVVNSSPLQLVGQRQKDGGGPETRLTLKLDNLDPQQYLGLFPEIAKSISLSAERADAVLEISLRENGAADERLNATGSVTFSNLLLQSADSEERPDQAFRLTSPTAHVILRANPLQRQYAVDELLLEEPQLDLPSSMAGLLDGSALAAKAAVLLNPAELGLAVGKLTLNKGHVRSGGQEWTDVQLELTGFKNLKAAAEGEDEAARLSLTARSGASSLAFTGAADSTFNLNGNFSLQHMQADWLRPFLPADNGLRFAKGGADITGALQMEQRAEGGPVLTVTGGAVTLRDFSLQQKKAALLTARSLNGSDCVLDGAAQSM
uniref:AsmA family protein n=1 Tax=Candidatus Electronema sp. TJ TaxID=3401573 RepID=UPI003AA94C5E